MREGRTLNIHISTRTLIKVVVVLAVLYTLYLVANIIALLFAAIILASTLDPLVNRLAKAKLPRALSIILIYLALAAIVGVSVYFIIPPLADETKELAGNLPNYLDRTSGFFGNLQTYSQRHNWPVDLQSVVDNFTVGLQSAAQSLVGALSGVFGSVFSCLLILVITFYLSVEEGALKNTLRKFLPAKNREHILKLIADIQSKMGRWLRGQLVLCFIIFLMTYISLSIFGLKYALVLALLAGIAEIIPYLGPTIAAIPAVLIAFVQAPLLALFILFVYIIIQLVENNILVPKIMQQAVGLDPIVSILVLMVGFKLGGVLGAILAIPLTTALNVILKDLIQTRHSRQHLN